MKISLNNFLDIRLKVETHQVASGSKALDQIVSQLKNLYVEHGFKLLPVKLHIVSVTYTNRDYHRSFLVVSHTMFAIEFSFRTPPN